MTSLHEICHILTARLFPLWLGPTPSGCGRVSMFGGESRNEFEYHLLGGMFVLECRWGDIGRLDRIALLILRDRNEQEFNIKQDMVENFLQAFTTQGLQGYQRFDTTQLHLAPADDELVDIDSRYR